MNLYQVHYRAADGRAGFAGIRAQSARLARARAHAAYIFRQVRDGVKSPQLLAVLDVERIS